MIPENPNEVVFVKDDRQHLIAEAVSSRYTMYLCEMYILQDKDTKGDKIMKFLLILLGLAARTREVHNRFGFPKSAFQAVHDGSESDLRKFLPRLENVIEKHVELARAHNNEKSEDVLAAMRGFAVIYVELAEYFDCDYSSLTI